MRGGVRQDPSAMQTLKLADFHALRTRPTYLSAVSPTVNSSGRVYLWSQQLSGSVKQLLTPVSQHPSVERGKRRDVGRMPIYKKQFKVCVIGKTIADNLFPDGRHPVGRIISFQ